MCAERGTHACSIITIGEVGRLATVCAWLGRVPLPLQQGCTHADPSRARMHHVAGLGGVGQALLAYGFCVLSVARMHAA